jgi:hypothetical protein
MWSSPLTDDMQYKPQAPYHTESAGPGDSFPKLELYTDKVNYDIGDTVRIIAVAHGPSGQIPFDALTGRTDGIKRPRPRHDLDFVEQPDRSYVASLDIPADVARKNRGDWGVFVDCQIDSQHRVATTMFTIVATDATITGPYRVALEDGSLSVYVGIDATAPGRQHLKGELWSAKDDPIAYSWTRNAETPVGSSTMKLVFYGKTIRDSGIDGPYAIKNLILTTYDENADPYANPPVDPGLTTPAFKASSFTDVPINGNNDTLLRKQKTLEGELQKAERDGYDPSRPELPPPVTPGTVMPQ